ncbi:heterokaryon incompatibility protein-domain-containing protein [Apiospora arundinis]
MRLISSSTLMIEDFLGSAVPPYAILSHTWDEEEISYQDMLRGYTGKKGFRKIEKTCKQAVSDGLEYVWVDTCCIDKSSSAELSESINSMFQWYKDSRVCYVYLSDLSTMAGITTSLGTCRWNRRGWTLQELIAPRRVEFFDHEWNFRGSKQNLLGVLSSVSGIDESVLAHKTLLSTVSVAAKMSWAARRETTRPEDIAYCLLGIFDINMPLLYGEGAKSFIRLQEEIIKINGDLSISVWTGMPGKGIQNAQRYSGILAEYPSQFKGCSQMTQATAQWVQSDFSVTNRGIRIPTSILRLPGVGGSRYHHVLALDCQARGETNFTFGIYLRNCGANLFVRDHPDRLATIPLNPGPTFRPRPIYIMAKLPAELYCVEDNPNPLDEVQFIIRHRVSAVQIILPPILTIYNVHPASHYDNQDMTVFSTERFHDGWCVFTMRGEIDIDVEQRLEVDCLFACWGWNSDPKFFVCTLVDTSNIDLAVLSRFMSEASQEQNSSQPWLFEGMEDHGIPLQGSVILGGDGNLTKTVKLTHMVRKIFQPYLCNS